MSSSSHDSVPHCHRRNLLLLVLLAMIVIVLAVLFFPRGAASQKLNPIQNLVACLTHNAVTVYGVDTCAECQNQKKIFGNAFSTLNYINCDFHQDVCTQNDIHYYPTWMQAGRRLVGLQSLPALADWSSCSY